MKNGQGVIEQAYGIKIEGKWKNNKLIKGKYIEKDKIIKTIDNSTDSDRDR